MSTKTILYSFWASSCSWRVRAALDYKGIKYQYTPLNINNGQQKSDEYAKLNPMKFVPTLIIDEKVIGQSLAILEYIEETRPDNPLMPKDVYQRAIARQMMQIISSDIQPLQNLKVLAAIKDLSNGDDTKKVEWARNYISSGFIALEKLLSIHSGKYCVGDHISFADLCLPPQVRNANRFKVDLTTFPNITRINEFLLTLPHFISSSPLNQPDFEQ